MVDPPGDHGKWPGLVLEWRRGDAGWEGHVAYATESPGQPAVLIVGWLPASCLRPAIG